MLKRKRLGREIRSRGMKGNIRSIYSTEYNLSLFELLKVIFNNYYDQRLSKNEYSKITCIYC